MTVSRRLKFARDAVEAVVGMLTGLPDGRERRRLVDDASECEREIQGWDQRPPTPEQHEEMMKRVLGLHIAAATLARSSRGGRT
jgi:hypothetical protein